MTNLPERANRIRELNDAFRNNLPSGHLMLTRGVQYASGQGRLVYRRAIAPTRSSCWQLEIGRHYVWR